jgi:ribulose-phosphate 3-epimerase
VPATRGDNGRSFVYLASAMGSIKIAPSVLAADLTRLGDEVQDAEQAGADMIHVDVMDGHFVPNISWGPSMVQALRRVTKLPLDVHLMVSDPARYVEAFARAGADIIGIHVEADLHAQRTLSQIRALGKKACITLNPQTPPSAIEYLLDDVDQILVMSVNPGFGAQKFLPQILPKLQILRGWIQTRGLEIDLEVDGGVDPVTAPLVVRAGANVLVAGAAVFGSTNRTAAIARIRDTQS